MTREVRTLTAGFSGMCGTPITVAAVGNPGQATLDIHGLHDEHAIEARDRIRAAILNSGLTWPGHAVTVTVTREVGWQCGTAADLAIAMAALGIGGAAEPIKHVMFIGELGLDGSVRPIRGIVSLVSAAADAGITEVVVPEHNLLELPHSFGLTIYGVSTLAQAAAFRTAARIHEASTLDAESHRLAQVARHLPDAAACDALMVAAAGSHHVALASPDQPQSLIAAAVLSELLPNLDDISATESACLYSLARTSRPEWVRPPLVVLDPASALTTIVGGGSRIVRPGAVSLAHHGVLLVIEGERLSRHASEALRACIDDWQVALARANGTVYLQAHFQLVLAHPPSSRRVVAPLMDRCAIRTVLAPAPEPGPACELPGQSFALMASRAHQARMAASERWADHLIGANGHVPERLLSQRPWRLAASAVRDLVALRELGSLTARGYTQVLQVAWTLADLAGRESPTRGDVQTAIELRNAVAA